MNIREVLEELGVEYSTHENSRKVREGWLGTVCPFCGHGAGETYLGFPIDGRFCSCWTCGVHRLGDALAALTGRTVGAVLPLIREIGGEAQFRPKGPPRGRLIKPWGCGPLLPAHVAYLRGRKVDPDVCVRLYRLEGLGIAGRYSWRLLFPLTRHGAEVSWATRRVCDDDPADRYLSAPSDMESYPHRGLLFAEDLARHTVAVVEGFFDAMRLGPGAAATMGVKVTPAQVNRIGRFPNRVVCFDSEPAAQERARRLCEQLEVMPGKTTRVQLDAADPGSATDKEVKRFRRLFLE